MEKSTASNDISDSLDGAIKDERAIETQKTPPTPLRCFVGALTASGFSLLAYRLLMAIATTFANKPIVSDNPVTINIAAAVRTLVMGGVALGAGVFGIAALGLTALGIQLLFKKGEVADS